MEYLAIIAFVVFFIFRAIKKSNEAKAEETGKTMLPGKKAIPSREVKRQSQSTDNWEDWFSDDKNEQKAPAIEKVITSTRRMMSVPVKKNPEKEITRKQPGGCERGIRLSSREEARRAMIYSEIFNRKY